MFQKVNRIISSILFVTLISSYSFAYAIYSSSTLVSLTNSQRSQNGLASLSTNQALTNAAQAKVNDMFAKGYFAHNSPDGKTPWDFIREAGYNYTYAGENLAIGYDDANELMTAWMNSPTHRDNIVNPNFKEVGIAASSGKYNGVDTIIVAQEFGATASAPSTNVSTSQSQTPVKSTPKPSTTSSPAAATLAIIQEKSRLEPTSIFVGEDVNFTVTVSGDVKSLQISGNGLDVNVLVGSAITNTGNQKTYNLAKTIDQPGNYDLLITATDSAGNQKSAPLGKLEVKPKVLAKDTNEENTGLFAGFTSDRTNILLVILGVAALSGATFVVVRHTKFKAKVAKASLAAWEF